MTNFYIQDILPIAVQISTSAASTTFATISGVAGRTAWLSGFEVTWGSQTTAGLVPVTVTNLAGPGQSAQTLTYNVFVPTAATAGQLLSVQYTSPIPCVQSGASGNIQVIITATSTMSSLAINAHGFYI